MVSLPEALGVLYPEAVPLRDYSVSDYGSGPQIVWWDAGLLGPIPTPEALAAVTQEAVEAARTARARNAARALVTSPDPIPRAVRALGIVVNAALNEIRSSLGLPIVKIDQAMAAVAAVIDSGEADSPAEEA
jgi:uncharacterized protein YkwD